MQPLVHSTSSPGHVLGFPECSRRGLSYRGIPISPLLIWADWGECGSRQAPYGSASAACPPWAFGPGCSEDCLCEKSHTRSCNPKDGSCSCKAGFQGEHCQAGESLEEREVGLKAIESLTSTSQFCLASHSAECEPGFFGPGCRHRCTCRPGVACDPVSGQCRTQCPPGYQGEDCGQGE